MKLLLISLLVLFGVLLIASVITALLVGRIPGTHYRELVLRVRTWWAIMVVFALAMLSPRWLSMTLFGMMSFLALKEYLTLIPTRQSDRMPLLWLFITIPINYLLAGIGWYGLYIIFIPVYVFLFLPMRMVLTGNTHDFLRSVSHLHWGLMTTVFCISHVAYLMVLPGNQGEQGALLVIFLAGLTSLNDVMQYVWGKTYGKRKITPRISPHKTLAGLLGGVGSTALAATIFGPILTPMHAPMACLAGILISLAGFVGDIVMSAIKRDIGVKDSGTLLPGHGGILDRLDSLIFTAPVFFHFIYYFYY